MDMQIFLRKNMLSYVTLNLFQGLLSSRTRAKLPVVIQARDPEIKIIM